MNSDRVTALLAVEIPTLYWNGEPIRPGDPRWTVVVELSEVGHEIGERAA